MRCYLNLLSLNDQPPRSFEDILAAGYEGVQFAEPPTAAQLQECSRLGLGRAGSARVNDVREAQGVVERAIGDGLECVTLHVGWGTEDDAEASRLIEGILAAADRIPLFVETHRATIFQDIWRTVQFVRRFPELRFNGDFSHWYTGLEMVYGGFEKKVEFIRPVLDRVRFLHGRIGNPGCIQVDIGDGDPSKHPYVPHFRTLWTLSFRGFLNDPDAGETILFVPELLSPAIYYGRTFAGREEGDRWEQSLVLRGIAEDCFESAASGSDE
jgi:hypothetical protein